MVASMAPTISVMVLTVPISFFDAGRRDKRSSGGCDCCGRLSKAGHGCSLRDIRGIEKHAGAGAKHED